MSDAMNATEGVALDMVMQPLTGTPKWLKLVGWSSIAAGVLTALSIIGLVVAWLPIWYGVTCLKAARGIQGAHDTGNARMLLEANQRLKTGFAILGVTMLIQLVLPLLIGLFGASLLPLLAIVGAPGGH